MSKNIYKFRRLKWGYPEHKLKMIPDEIGRKRHPAVMEIITSTICFIIVILIVYCSVSYLP